MYQRIPNTAERYEMVLRSLGKQYDWELERFRIAKKPIDAGNKKRLTKNLLRFIKNPIGYIYHKGHNFR